MTNTAPSLDLRQDVVALTGALVDIESVSGNERPLADAIERELRALGRYEVIRCGDAVLARTQLDKDRRVVLAGHLDTVPISNNLPSRVDGDRIFGCGTSDMKAGDAVMLRLAATLDDPAYDLTFIFYDNEEVAAVKSGLGRVTREYRQWLYGDLAIVLEPTGGVLEAGCQGTIRARVATTGVRAHTARAWLGDNAVHKLAELLARLAAYRSETHVLDGIEYREGMNAVRIAAGVAGNVVPDEATIDVNFRYAPHRDAADAEQYLRTFLDGYEFEITDHATAAKPALSDQAMQHFVQSIGVPVTAKYGWTDVSRFSAFKIPAINFGPGDPGLAHKPEESASIPLIIEAEQTLRRYLTTPY